MSGTLSGEWQPASNRVNDSGRRQRSRECQIGHTGYRFAPAEAVGIAVGQKPVHSGLVIGSERTLRSRAVRFGSAPRSGQLARIGIGEKHR